MSFKLLKSEIIDKGLCQGCGLCSGNCKHIDLVDMKPQLKDYCIVEKEGLACGKCYSDCPQIIQKKVEEIKPLEIISVQSTNSDILKHAENGGFITTLSKYLLETKNIDQLITVKNINGTPKSMIIKDPEEVLKNPGVFYGRTGVLKQLIKAAEGDHKSIGIIGLPCEIRGATNIDSQMQGKLELFKIGLFCNANIRTPDTDRGIIKSPCSYNCPAGVNAARYIELTKEGKYQDALELIREMNPFPSVCGRICTNECEFGCTLHQSSNPIAVREIKRFLTEWEMKQKIINPQTQSEKKERIAIIGAGPSGLSAAYYLAKMGYAPTVFERSDKIGGMLRLGIPQFRLPDDVLDHDIEFIKSAGVKIETNVEIGKQLTLNDLKKQGFKAFYFAMGQYSSNKLNIEGENAKGIYYALDFLLKWKYNHDISSNIFKDKVVAVIGGGSVALDSAQTVKRFGAKKVLVIYRRSEKELPARQEDYENSIKEGIEFQFLRNPVKFISDSENNVKQIELVKMELGEPDSTNRCVPIVVKNSEYRIDVDFVIVAIGQSVESTLIQSACDDQLDIQKGKINIDKITYETNVPGIFAGGDIVVGSKNIAVTAIAQGREAAESIDRFLRGVDLKADRTIKPNLFDDLRIEIPKKTSPRPPTKKLQNFFFNFEDIHGPLEEDFVKKESIRCLNCNNYCLHCQDFAGVYADVAAGDLGSENKYTTVIIWTPRAQKIIQEMIDKGLLIKGKVSKDDVDSSINRKIKREIINHTKTPRERIYNSILLEGPNTISGLSKKLNLDLKTTRYNALRLAQEKKIGMKLVEGSDEPIFNMEIEE